jgi:predicted PhzF superfamily epimerase YddE/YHI9
MAAGNLGYYLFEQMNLKVDEIIIEQGYFMENPSKSEIIVRLNHDGKTLQNIMAGGSANVGEVIEVDLK